MNRVSVASPVADEATLARATEWVRPDEGRIFGRVYADAELFDLEIRRIWHRTWLYAGHESEIPESGDYVTRTVGRVPIIMCRRSDGTVEVLVNQCAHRGTPVCNHEQGNASSFRCPYHGWTYGNDGRLRGVPYPGGYGPDFDRGAVSLPKPRRIDSYRGFVFISYSDGGPPLDKHLGNVREPIDRFIDISPTGKVRLDAGYNRLRLDANWKIFVENTSDMYHSNFVHASAFSEDQRPLYNAMSADESRAIVRALDNGHTEMDFRPQNRVQGTAARTGIARDVDDATATYLAALGERLGVEAAETLVREGEPLLYVYPNLLMIQQDVRRLEPISTTASALYQYPAMLDGAPDEINDQRLARHEAAYGPAGFIIPDDQEVFGRTQRAVNGDPDTWLMLNRGLNREYVDADGVPTSHVTDETGMRGMWRKYLEYLTS